jgi:hypothetical protein
MTNEKEIRKYIREWGGIPLPKGTRQPRDLRKAIGSQVYMFTKKHGVPAWMPIQTRSVSAAAAQRLADKLNAEESSFRDEMRRRGFRHVRGGWR